MRSSRFAVAATGAAFFALLAPAAAALPKAGVEGVADRVLRGEVERAIGETIGRPDSLFEARRRARDAASDALALLRSEGYYLASAEPTVEDAQPPRALVRITLGPRFTLSPPDLAWSGPEPDPAAVEAARLALALHPGAPGRAADVIAAEGRAVAALQKRGYADAAAQPRTVVVDDADRSVRPTFRIAAGERVRLGAVRLVTRGRTNPGFIEGLAPWRRGDTYDPDKVAKLEHRLFDVGAYESVTVALAPRSEDVDGLRPVIVSLADRPRNTLELGATYAASEDLDVEELTANSNAIIGSGVEARYIRYNLLGRADSTSLTAVLHDIQQKLDLELDLPDWGRGDQILKLGAGYAADRTPAFDDSDGGVRAGVERHFTKTTFITLGGALDLTTTEEKTAVNLAATPVGEQLHLFIVTGFAGFNLDRSDNPLDPTRGWRLEIHLEPTQVTGDRTLTYVKAVSQASAYLPLDSQADTVIAARVRLGSILGGEFPDVPADRRFYSGGGGSVRGYGYQDVGPRLEDNTPAGGVSLFESSFEVRRKITDRWAIAAFVDAGQVGETPAPVFAPLSVGAGLGVRYDLGFAPFRVDIATPLEPRKGDAPVQVYVSIGQSF